jgi:hypothetical protein
MDTVEAAVVVSGAVVEAVAILAVVVTVDLVAIAVEGVVETAVVANKPTLRLVLEIGNVLTLTVETPIFLGVMSVINANQPDPKVLVADMTVVVVEAAGVEVVVSVATVIVVVVVVDVVEALIVIVVVEAAALVDVAEDPCGVVGPVVTIATGPTKIIPCFR